MAIEVQTTQNVTIDYEPAGIGNRLLAYLLDCIVIALWILGWVGLYSITDGAIIRRLNDTSYLLFFIIVVASPIIFYHLFWEYFNNGQSPGKMIMKIRVVNTDGTIPSSGSYLLRWLFRIVDIDLTNGTIGIIMIVTTAKSQRLGDYLAGTTVISLKVNSNIKQLKALDLDFHENYQVTYSDVLNRLSDRDIQTINAIIDDEKMKENTFFVKQLTDRTKALTGYIYNGSDIAFLKKVVSDYNYLALQ